MELGKVKVMVHKFDGKTPVFEKWRVIDSVAGHQIREYYDKEEALDYISSHQKKLAH